MNRRLLRQITAYLLIQVLSGLPTAAPAAGLLKPLENERSTNEAQDTTPLEVGKSIERELKGGESHLYRITLTVGQFMHVVVDQRGIDVVAVLFGPDGNPLVEADSPNGAHGAESVSAVAEVSGTYRLEVRSLEKDAPTGRYRLQLELRTAKAQDRDRVEADRASRDAALLRAQGTAESLRKSIEKHKEALSLYRVLGDRLGESQTLTNLGTVYNYLGEQRIALDYFAQALPLTQAIGDRATQATILNNLGRVYHEMGETQTALKSLIQALLVFREVGNRTGEAITLSNIGAIYDRLGENEKALESFEQALALVRAIGDRHGEATVLNNIGRIYQSLGDLQKALDHLSQALSFRHAILDHRGEATTLNNLGAVYSSLGEKQKALDYYAQALPLHRTAGDRVAEATTLRNIGKVYDDLGEKQRALAYYEQALPLTRASGDRGGEAMTLNDMGAVHSQLGNKQKALEYYEQALSLIRAIENRVDEATALNNIGNIYSAQGERQKALNYYNRALLIMKAIGDRKGEADALFAIGSVYESLGDLPKALGYYLQVISTREQLRSILTSEESRLNFAEASAEPYKRAILIYIRTGKGDLAFNLSEMMRARNLLDQLAGAYLPSRGEGNREPTKQEATLRQQMNRLEHALREERRKPSLKIDQNLVRGLETQLASVRREYEYFLTRIKLAVPERSGNTLTVPEVQRLLGSDITVLSYLVTSSKTIAFLISKNSFQVVELSPAESELFEAIREFRSFPTVKTWRQDELSGLYQQLVNPIRRYLRTPVVGIVPHGVLHYIPFSALSDGSRYFDTEHTIFYLPSVSALPYILKNRKADDSLLAVAYSSPEGEPLLKYADQEARSIARLYDAQVLTGTMASEEKVRAIAGSYGILHLAANYELNTQSPVFSRIVLAPSKNDDGLLEVNEVYRLDLRKTDLVVLSGCKTQLGKQIGGDDSIGLNRAFISAGAATVIGSLWDVDDLATSSLMNYFYKYLKQGMSKAEALRKAQVEMRVKYPHPFYWAAFTLTGDPGPTSTQK